MEDKWGEIDKTLVILSETIVGDRCRRFGIFEFGKVIHIQACMKGVMSKGWRTSGLTFEDFEVLEKYIKTDEWAMFKIYADKKGANPSYSSRVVEEYRMRSASPHRYKSILKSSSPEEEVEALLEHFNDEEGTEAIVGKREV